MFKKTLYFFVFGTLLLCITENLYAGKDSWSFTGDIYLKSTETIRSIAIH